MLGVGECEIGRCSDDGGLAVERKQASKQATMVGQPAVLQQQRAWWSSPAQDLVPSRINNTNNITTSQTRRLLPNPESTLSLPSKAP
jgi:hypothetical protein